MCADAVPLRPHHGMCLAYFAGRGYSGEFTARMGRVKAGLGAETPVRLTVGPDTICGACPHNLAGICETAEKVEKYDREVLRRCGLHEGQVLRYGAFRAAAERCILAQGRRREICGDCEWSPYCG